MMTDLTKLKKGDYIVRFGVVHQISKIENITNSEGKKDKILYFEPKYKNRRNDTLRLSIPLSSLDKTTIRLPFSKTEMREELKFLRQSDFQRIPFNGLQVKRIISTNQLRDLSRVLKTLWEEKRDETRNFTISKRNTFKMVIQRFQQEVAFVLNLSLDEALEKITSALDTGWKRQQKFSDQADN
jgi:RNA polymerase-interacting CarD/CdnL/TRCF family regulator